MAAVAVFAFLCVYFTGQFPPWANPNEVSRLEAVYAFVERGTFRLDDVLPLLGDHEDKAASGGHFYSNKAPGLAFAAIPVYRVLRLVFPAPRSVFDAIFSLVRILTVSLLTVVALARLTARLPPGPGAALVPFAVAFATPLLFYGRSFFGHAWAAALLFLAWDLVRLSEERVPSWRTGVLLFGAGLVAGWAVLSEYTTAPVAVLLAARAVFRRPVAAWLLFGAGGAIPLALLLGYNASCFGSPWVLSYAREAYGAYAAMVSKGLVGFGAPSPRTAWNYLFHPARGLLLFSPFWFWLVPGFLAWWRSRTDRGDCLFALTATAAFFLLLTGYPNWEGGWSLGNRYLLPVVFLAGLAVARGIASPVSRGLFALALAFSAAAHFLLASAWPHIPENLSWPPATASLWFLERGWVAPNLLSSLGWVSLVPPALLIGAAGVLAVRAARPLSPRALVAAPAGLMLFVAMVLLAPEPNFGARLWRAFVYGSYSGLDPAREELKRAVQSASTPREMAIAADAWRRYGR
jgi:hypothetical protein